jgi:hypothetical protein
MRCTSTVLLQQSTAAYLLTTCTNYFYFSVLGVCGLVVRVLGYRSGGPGSIPGTTDFLEKKEGDSSGSVTGSTQPRYN